MSSPTRYYPFGIILVQIVTKVLAYHFDVDNVILYEDPAGNGLRRSHFGYTVALWNPGKGSSDGPWIFIGAPRANSSANAKANEPGTVFKCKVGKKCEEWAVDRGNVDRRESGSRLGGTMSIQNNSNPEILVCGPNWVNSYWWAQNHFLRGMCYWAKASDTSNVPNTSQNPLSRSHPFFGVTDVTGQQAGFSIHMVPDSSPLEFVMGCPGALSWHGTQIHYKKSLNGFSTPFVSPKSEDVLDYAGYAVSSGNYYTTGKRIYASGAPRGGYLRGRVDLYTIYSTRYGIRSQEYSGLQGTQIGEYFGSALASCDIDGDGRDDLLVGAPQWSKTSDEGRIYVYRGIRSTSSNTFKISDHFEGKTPRGRFGSAITCLGDVDHDGYADVAVGAPYDGNGTVHIFHGGKNGLRLSQIIAAPTSTKGFGTSISEPRDIDNNDYADIAVGASLSGHVTLIRSKRVVTTTVTISPNLSGGQLKLTTKVFSITVCSSYAGAYAPQELNITRELKIDEMYGRAEVEIDGEYFKTYKHSETLKSRIPKTCRDFKIKIDKQMANFDYFTPLEISVSQRLHTIQRKSSLVIKPNGIDGTDKFHTLEAVTDGTDAAVVDTRKILFELECDNNICHPDLFIELSTDLTNGKQFVIGSRPDLQLFVKVNNSGDNAYLAKAVIDIPIFIGVLKLQSECVEHYANNTHIQVICDIDHPFAKKKTNTFNLHLNMSSVPINTTNIIFKGLAKSLTKDSTNSGNHENDLLIESSVEADIGITGKTDVDWYSYMATEKEERPPKIMFQHTYEIKNHEVTPLAEALLSISIPTHFIKDDNEIEIVKLNETVGDLDGEKFNCQNPEEASNNISSRLDATVIPEWLMSENSSKIILQKEKKFTSIDGKIFSASPDNRTVYINTTNPSVKWKTVDCIIGPFRTARSAARVVLTFDLLLSNFTPEIMQEKDIIFFATNGSTKITMPPNFTQTVNKKPDVIMIGTTFVGSTAEHQVATWVIALSIMIGLLLLMLIIVGLFKFGFFKRSKQMELKALIEQEKNAPPELTLQTGPSMEDLEIT